MTDTHLKTLDINYNIKDQWFSSYAVYPQCKPKITVLIFPDFAGLNKRMMNIAHDIANQGYLAIAIDVYGHRKTGNTKKLCIHLMNQLLESTSLNFKDFLIGTFNAVKTINQVDLKSISAFGFCLGGMCVLDMVRAGLPLNKAVSFHGSLGSSLQDVNNMQPISTQILVFHGHNDPMIKPDAVLKFEQEMTSRQADWQVHVYGNTLHAFTNPDANDLDFGVKYNKISSDRAWKSAFNFIAE